MGKVFNNKICIICGKKTKVIEVWGKFYCKECYEKKPKRGGGNSGMIKDYIAVEQFEKQLDLFHQKGLHLIQVPKGNKVFATLYLEHYPNSKGIVGRSINYLIIKDGKLIGIIGANSPPLNYKKFVEYFKGYSEKNYLNNNVFRLIVNEKNLGTKVLKLFRKQIKKDYEKKYGDELVGLVTFVEPPRTGAVYKADNWDFLGYTQGVECKRRGSLGKWINKEFKKGTKKLIFAKWLIKKK